MTVNITTLEQLRVAVAKVQSAPHSPFMLQTHHEGDDHRLLMVGIERRAHRRTHALEHGHTRIHACTHTHNTHGHMHTRTYAHMLDKPRV